MVTLLLVRVFHIRENEHWDIEEGFFALPPGNSVAVPNFILVGLVPIEARNVLEELHPVSMYIDNIYISRMNVNPGQAAYPARMFGAYLPSVFPDRQS